MNTPIIDFVKEYSEQGGSRFHMPGHKGVARLGCEAWDITEIEGADDLYHAEDIILESEQNASSLFGSRHTFYSTEGSSLCIRAMLYLAQLHAPAGTRRLIWAARNAHKTFLYACALLDLDVTWLYPETELSGHASLCSCPISPATLRRKLAATPAEVRPLAVFLTSPDYLGGMQDIAGLAAVCHDYDIPLLVDNAHGAYLKFLTPSRHPLDLGADLCCDSAHKTLPALTGCAYLHVSRQALFPYEQDARMALALFGSTSPSYLLLQSLDRCNALLAEDYTTRLQACLEKRDQISRHPLLQSWLLPDTDSLKLVLQARTVGRSGTEIAELLRARQMECEYADRDYLVLMVTPDNTDEDWERLQTFLTDLAAACPPEPTSHAGEKLQSDIKKEAAPKVQPGIAKLSIREALMSIGETLPLEQTLGRICASPTVSCPPAIPIAISGELITENTLALCRYYQIDQLHVVKD